MIDGLHPVADAPTAVGATEWRFTWRFQLYRLFNAVGELLYIGITGNMNKRFEKHVELHHPWWPEVARCTIEFYPDRVSLKTAESSAIYLEQPIHNEQHRSGKTHLAALKRASRPPRVTRTFGGTAGVERVAVVDVDYGLRELRASNAETRAQRSSDLIAKHQVAIAELSQLRLSALNELMAEGWTSKDVADLLNVSITRISQLRTGRQA
jgi:hypothetical protein